MKYIVTYKEKCTTIGMVTSTVEADSEEEAKSLIEDGMGDIEDFVEIENYDNEILSFLNVEEYYDD